MSHRTFDDWLYNAMLLVVVLAILYFGAHVLAWITS